VKTSFFPWSAVVSLSLSVCVPRTLQAGVLDHFNFSTVPSPQVMNSAFPVTVTAVDSVNSVVTSFNGTVNLSALTTNTLPSGTILGSPSWQVGANGPVTVGYSFTPSTSLTVTHVRHYSGSKVSIWTDAGVLLASQNVVSTERVWLETALPSPITLQANTTYRVGVYTAANWYYRNAAGPTTFAYGTIDHEYSYPGDGFPIYSYIGDTVPFVDLRYTPQAPAIAVQPAVSGNFLNGAWSGLLTITQAVTNVHLHATDGASHAGDGNSFDVRTNTRPVAVADTVTILPGTTSKPFNVLTNDSDADGDPLTVSSFTQPSAGALTSLGGGTFTYAPDPAVRKGSDEFSYTISDGNGGTAAAKVTIYIGYMVGGDWPTFGNGPDHTGYYPTSLGTNRFAPLWTNSFTLAINQVAVGNGRVFVTTPPFSGYTGDAFLLRALDAQTGGQMWQDNFNWGYGMDAPTYDNGKVYFQRVNNSSDTQLRCVDAYSGTVLWTAAHGAQWESYYAPTVVGDGVWVNGGTYGGLYGFNTSNGSQRFFVSNLGQVDEWTPTFYRNVLYSWVAGTFRAHNPVSGALLWSTNLAWNATYSMNTVVAAQGDRAFVMANAYLYAIDLSSHAVAWTVTNSFKGSPAVANGVVYVISSGLVRAFSFTDGAFLGSYSANGDTGLSGQPTITDDALFISSSSATYVFDLQSFQLVQTVPTGGSLSLANGTLYVGGGTRTLKAFGIETAPFPDDLALTLSSSPQSVPVFQTVAYTMTVSNSGPASASGVRVTNTLPPNATFVSAVASQGTCTNLNGTVVCTLGTLPGGVEASMTVTVIPTEAGTLLDSAQVTASALDANTFNNRAQIGTTVFIPVAVNNVVVKEGNTGTTNAIFTVSLAASSTQSITVNYATSNGTATASSDYVAKSGTLTFPAGTTNQTITVVVNGDTLVEPDEVFYLNLSGAANAVIADGQGQGTILDNDSGIFLAGVAVEDTRTGNGNGTPDPGEIIRLYVGLLNAEVISAQNLASWLSCTTPGITPLNTNSAYPLIPAGGLGTNLAAYEFYVAKSVSCGTALRFTQVSSLRGKQFTNTFTLPTLPASWTLQAVDTNGSVGASSSLAMDALGHAHIAYYDASNQLLKYALWNGSAWSFQTVDFAGSISIETCITLGTNGQPRIAYRTSVPGAFKYAWWDGSAWQIEIVDTGFVGLSPSLAIDRFDRPHIASFDAGNDVLKYSTRSATEWTNQVVDSAGRVGDYHSIAVDSNGYPRIAYSGDNAYSLKYAAWDGASWSVQTIESASSIADCSIALDQNGLPRIAWANIYYNVLRYAAWDGVNWNTKNVDATSTPYFTSLKVDHWGNPHISYQDLNKMFLKYATWNGTNWNVQLVDTNGNVGYMSTSLALDPSDRPAISYYDASNGDLKFAHLNGGCSVFIQPPVADSQSVLVTEDTPQAITLTGSDSEGYALTFSVVALPTNGVLTGVAPSLIYQPVTNYFGPDNFSFRVDDGIGNSATGQVAITIAQVRDAGPARLALGGWTNGQLWCSLLGEPSEHYRIQASQDLVNWVTLTNLIPANGPLPFVDPDAAYLPQRFYRAVLQLTLPQISSPAFLSNGGLQLNFSGDVGRNYQVLASTNLVDWVVLTNMTATGLSTTFTDSDASGYPCRFYRACPSP
jgi:uncharacterized repeat protein (TIGR01451 family)